MRHFLLLAYHGAAYSGWQTQPNAPSVQATLEAKLSLLLHEPMAVVGCGRTDAGVHARYYVAHMDTSHALPERFLQAINGMLPPDIGVIGAQAVAPQAHARFDAISRSYVYAINFQKNPFERDRAWFFPHYERLDFDTLRQVADLYCTYDAFQPFCKSGSGLEHFRCRMLEARWTRKEGPVPGLEFHVSANRFLRGMVRLMVGACIEAAMGKVHLDDIRRALDTQTPLRRNLSAPAHGLALTDVRYPYPVGATF